MQLRTERLLLAQAAQAPAVDETAFALSASTGPRSPDGGIPANEMHDIERIILASCFNGAAVDFLASIRPIANTTSRMVLFSLVAVLMAIATLSYPTWGRQGGEPTQIPVRSSQ
jgi:hypothetical protein